MPIQTKQIDPASGSLESGAESLKDSADLPLQVLDFIIFGVALPPGIFPIQDGTMLTRIRQGCKTSLHDPEYKNNKAAAARFAAVYDHIRAFEGYNLTDDAPDSTDFGRSEKSKRGSPEKEDAESNWVAVNESKIRQILQPMYEELDGGSCAKTNNDSFVKLDNSNTEARLICAECPVQHTCLEYALISMEDIGVWGGSNLKERKLFDFELLMYGSGLRNQTNNRLKLARLPRDHVARIAFSGVLEEVQDFLNDKQYIRLVNSLGRQDEYINSTRSLISRCFRRFLADYAAVFTVEPAGAAEER